jgi:predicted transcriptional regulator
MTAARSHRINARLSPELARKTAYLEQRLNLSTTEIIHQAIERYYAEVTQEAGRAGEALTSAGFVACAEGPVDLSRSYKKKLARSLGKKA